MSNHQTQAPHSSWLPVIGLEIHAQLKAKQKLFSPEASFFTMKENINIHPVSLGFPGTLPVLNLKALEYSLRTGLALNCRINKKSVFARKNYFYPDLPKGYQISQYEQPLCEEGHVVFDCEGKRHKVRIRRVHIEEDAGQLRHLKSAALVNFNRAGVPLVEIVTEPDMHSPKAAAKLARAVRSILKYIGVCDGSLEEGSLRCDCNISVQKNSAGEPLGVRTELKNLNSFKFMEKALGYEIKRHIFFLEQGQKIPQETRLYDSAQNKTFSMRSKEEAGDYRYFPDPDLPPLQLKEEWIQSQKQKIPELPLEKSDRFQKEHQLSLASASLLAEEKDRADYFEQMVQTGASALRSANWLLNEMPARLSAEKKTLSSCPVPAQNLGEMIQLVDQKILSGKMAKEVFLEMWKTGARARAIMKKRNLTRLDDESILLDLIQKTIHQFPKQTADYKAGKKKIFGFFVGEIMKITRGQADPQKLTALLKKKLDS